MFIPWLEWTCPEPVGSFVWGRGQTGVLSFMSRYSEPWYMRVFQSGELHFERTMPVLTIVLLWSGWCWRVLCLFWLFEMDTLFVSVSDYTNFIRSVHSNQQRNIEHQHYACLACFDTAMTHTSYATGRNTLLVLPKRWRVPSLMLWHFQTCSQEKLT